MKKRILDMKLAMELVAEAFGVFARHLRDRGRRRQRAVLESRWRQADIAPWTYFVLADGVVFGARNIHYDDQEVKHVKRRGGRHFPRVERRVVVGINHWRSGVRAPRNIR